MFNEIYHNLDPIAFAIGPVTVRWYGIAYILGFACAALVIWRLAKRWRVRVDEDALLTIMVCVIVGIILGGRLGYVLFYGDGFYFSHPWEIFALNHGGMSFHGGLIGALMLAALALCNPYEIIQGQHVWGARMLILASARPREGLVQTLLILAQLFSMLIGAVSTLCAAAQALETAFPKLRFFSLWLCAALLLGALMATAFFGMDVLLAVSPFLLIPEGILIGISFFKKAPS